MFSGHKNRFDQVRVRTYIDIGKIHIRERESLKMDAEVAKDTLSEKKVQKSSLGLYLFKRENFRY